MEKLLAHREQPIPSLVAANPEVPPGLDYVFSKMVAKNPNERYQMMSEVLRDLTKVAAGAPVAAPLLIGGDSGDDAAIREFLAAISPAAGSTELRARSRRPASETLVSQAAANTQTSLLRTAVARVTTLSAWQRLIAAGGAVAVLLVVGMLMLSGGSKPVLDKDAEEASVEPSDAPRKKEPADSQSAKNQSEKPADAATAPLPLFNGRDLTGWKSLGTSQWRVEENALTTTGAGKGWLMSEAEFADFELELDYRLPAGGNSGIFLRCWPEGDISGGQFLEIQLLDDAAPEFRNIPPQAKNASIFAAAAPDPSPDAPAGQWNHVEIALQGRALQVFFNGVRVQHADLDAFREQFARFPGLTRQRGHIGFQDYGPGIQFRNVRARELAPSR